MFPKFLLDSDDDWIESVRLNLYPALHPLLKPFNGYAVGKVGGNQYVGLLAENEDAIEEVFDDRGRRNPIACLKSLEDGRVSEGSWVILHEDGSDLVEPGMQLHMTLFRRADGEPGREVYAHYEDDWRVSPFDHLRAKNFDVPGGVAMATDYLNENTYLILK